LFFFSSRRRNTSSKRDWSSDVCSSDLLDTQYRTENSNMRYWSTRQNALSRMESLMNEQSKDGLQATMDNFWESLQDLSNEPEDSGARSVVAERGLAVAETFNHL